MEFEARKLAALKSLASPLPDKSRKGGVDAPIAPLIARINRHPAFFTTSSCSGRISISISSPLPEQQQGEDQAEELTGKTKQKKKGGDWSYVTHSHADAEEIVRTVLQSCGHNMEEAGQQQHGLMVFRFEPFILAVECRDLVAAQALVSCAISSGFRESGITSIRKRIIAAVRCSLRIEAPIAEDGHLLVSEDYLRFLVGIANVKMLNNHQRTQKFLSSFIDQVESPSHDEGIESTSQDIRRHSHESSTHLKEKHFPYECKGKPRKFNTKGRKLSELEKRQVRLLSRLDEVEARLCDLVPKYGGGVDHDASSAIGGALDQKPMGNRNIQGMDALAQLNVLFKDDLADSEVECVSAQECEQRIEKDLHDLCEKGRSRGVAFSSLSVTSEKLYRWGHSACFLRCIPGMPSRSLLVFGGYGGSVRQCRQNDLVLLTIDDGKVQSICADNPPTPRMGHTASLVGKKMVVIGGREDPSKPLGDVCVLLLDKVQWVYPKVRGAFFPPRHRHGAVTVGEKIYVFGGLDNVNVLGDIFILDTSLMQWSRAECAGRVPAPRYSHSLSVVDQKIYLFGGFDGRTVYGDLWVFNLVKLTWSTVKLFSIPRFSHSMTISSGFLILLGGCPLTKHENAVSLLHVDRMEWVHAKTDLPSECLFVRHTATCIGDQIVIIGGGVSCYAFGIKFSPPFLMGLASLSPHLAVKDGKKGLGNFAIDHLEDEVMSMNDAWGLKIDKVHAKICKDNLKQLGWLDTKRKAKVGDDGLHIIFPITIEGVCELRAADAGHAQELLQGCRDAEFARSLIDFEIVQLKQHTELKVSKQPLQVLHIAIFSLLQKCGMPPSLLHELPKRWERLDDMAVLPENSFTSEIWSSLGQALWTTVAKSLNVHRVARQARVKASSTRDSNLLLLFGCNGWVHHRENGILYCFDATKCMFSSGNISEKLRMAKLDCTGETIVDLFAGIGYFVLPFLLKANAKEVYACEWNPPALDALRYNLHANAVEDRCTVLEGDNRITAPHGVADRVCLGLLPTSEHCWDLAVKALRPAGGMLHIHGNVKDTEEQQWVDHVCVSIRSLSENDGLQWDVHATHVERVKWYAPHIRHLVVDVKCNWKDDSEFSMQSF